MRLFVHRPRPPATDPSPEVPCVTTEVMIEGKQRSPAKGLCVTCTRCGAHVQMYGRTPKTIRAAFAELRTICPRKEHNRYVVPETQ